MAKSYWACFMSWELDLVTIRLRVPKYGWTEMCTERLQLSSYKTAPNPPVITMVIIKNVPVRLKSFPHNTFSSVTRSCPILHDSMDCSTPGFPVHHQFPELAQTHVHWVSDTIQPSHPLSLASPSALNLSQLEKTQWVDSSHQVAKVLELQLQHQSFQWIFRTDFP